MNMLYFRSCPHCKTGTVLLDWDLTGSFFECLNCGWMLDLSRSQAAQATDADGAEQEAVSAAALAASTKAA
jgi:hypothetical protein